MAQTAFAVLADVTELGFPASAFGTLSTAAKQRCLDRANALVGAKLAGRYPGINVTGSGWTWDTSIVGAAVSIACKFMLDVRGRNPSTANADKLIDDNSKEALEYLKAVQSQSEHPNITGGETAGSTSQGPVVLSTSTYWTNSGETAGNRGI